MCHFLSLSPLIFQPLRFTEQIPVSFSQTELMLGAMNDAARNGRSCAVKTLILPPPSPKPPQLSPYNCLQFHLTHQTSTYVKSSQRLNWTFSIISQLVHSTESTIVVHSIRRISLHGTRAIPCLDIILIRPLHAKTTPINYFGRKIPSIFAKLWRIFKQQFPKGGASCWRHLSKLM